MSNVVKFPISPLYKLYQQDSIPDRTYQEWLEHLVMHVIVDSVERERVLTALTDGVKQ